MLLALIVPGQLSARKVYAELLGHEKGLFSRKVKVTVDFGQNVSFWKAGDMTIVDENGKDIVFNSMVDAMNFMGTCGWEFVQAYVVTLSSQNVYHWLMTKDVNSDEEIKAGFNVRSDLRADNSDDPTYVLTYVRKRKSGKEWDVVKIESGKYSQEEVQELTIEWKGQTSEIYEYDIQIKKEK